MLGLVFLFIETVGTAQTTRERSRLYTVYTSATGSYIDAAESGGNTRYSIIRTATRITARNMKIRRIREYKRREKKKKETGRRVKKTKKNTKRGETTTDNNPGNKKPSSSPLET